MKALIWPCLIAALSWPVLAHAQDEEALQRAAARDLALQAADAYDSGNFERALDRFTRAQQLFPAPTLSIMQARCLVALGRWVEGLEMYNQTARTPLAADAPEPFSQAVREAELIAQELGGKLPRIELRVPGDTRVSVTIDERPVPSALHDVMQPIDPGGHVVSAAVDGHNYHSEAVTLAAAEQRIVTIPAPAAPKAAAVVPLRRPSAHAEDSASPQPPPAATPGWVVPTAFAVGGVGAIGAVASFAVARGVKADLDAVCTPGCPPSSEQDLSDYRLLQATFYSGAALTLVGFGVGLYFLMDEDPNAPTLALYATPNGAQLTGRF